MPVNPKSLKNLKPVKPGQVLNPTGINRKRPWTERYSIWSEAALPEKIRQQFNLQMGEEILKKGVSWADAATLRRHMEALLDGGTPAAKEIADRIEGKSATFEDEKVDAKEAHVYLVVGEEKTLAAARPVTAAVEVTGAANVEIGTHHRPKRRKS